MKRQNSTSGDPRGAVVVQRAGFLEYNVSVYRRKAQAQGLPDDGCYARQEAGTLGPPATNSVPTRWNALFLKSAAGNRDFFYCAAKGRRWGPKKKKISQGLKAPLPSVIFFNLQAAPQSCCSCSPNPGALGKI